MEQEDVERFLRWLINNTSLSESTIKTYLQVTKRFFSEYEELDIKNVNEFISRNARRKRNFYYKAAMVQYMKSRERWNDIIKVVKTRTKLPKKRPGIYLDRATLFKIIDNIDDDKLKLVALLQLYTGCRSYEILKLRWGDIRSDGMLHIRDEKSHKTITKGIPSKLRDRMMSFMPKEASPESYIFWNPDQRKDLSMYKFYLNHLKKAAGIVADKRFATHDFRRNFCTHAERYFIKQGDPQALEKVSALMGHASIDQTKAYLAEVSVDKKKIAEELYED